MNSYPSFQVLSGPKFAKLLYLRHSLAHPRWLAPFLMDDGTPHFKKYGGTWRKADAPRERQGRPCANGGHLGGHVLAAGNLEGFDRCYRGDDGGG